MIALLTDFGQSEYVGTMKAVIYSINPQAKITDLCHSVTPQNLIEAAWILKNNYSFFPRGTTFCCVVDPGVGSERKAIAVRTNDYNFIAPDNGLLWETIKDLNISSIIQLPVPEDASRTFHGRDIFAKAAANVDLNPNSDPGEQINEMEKLELYRKDKEGVVVRIDSFGNIVTNLPTQYKNSYLVDIGGEKYTMSFCETYSNAKNNELFLIEGSCDTLEISLKNGNANDMLCLKSGQRISIS